MKNLKTRDVMNEMKIGELSTILSDASIYKAADKMFKNGIHSLLVISGKNKNISGIITTYDIIKAIADESDPYKTLVKHVMSKELIYVHPDKDLLYALRLMLKKAIHRMVVFEDEKIKGMLTFTDITNAFLKRKRTKTKLQSY